MRRCLALAARGAGRVSPNPMVGAVLVGEDGGVLGEGWHRAYGGPHAERQAVRSAEKAGHGAEALQKATLYVNLEPCAHHGKQPPCADLVLEKKIPRVICGMADPFPEVAGRGIRRLRAAGVEVEVGTLEKECWRLNEAFFHRVKTGRPLLTLKTAQTLDAQIATSMGDARWVSGRAARTLVHRWRAELDGVLVGSGTAKADNPRLTVRHTEGRQPLRFVLDRAGALRPDLHLFADEYAALTTAVLSDKAEAPPYAETLQEAGGRVWRLPERDGHLDLGALLDRLGAEGGVEGRPLRSLLVEAGPGLATALFRHDLVDRYFCFIAPKLIGTGTPVVRGLGVEKMAGALTFAEHVWETAGADLLFKGYRRAAGP